MIENFGASAAIARANPIATIVLDLPRKRNAADRATALPAAFTEEGAAGYDVVFIESLAGAAAFTRGAGRHGDTPTHRR